jgi:hypothetical protein
VFRSDAENRKDFPKNCPLQDSGLILLGPPVFYHQKKQEREVGAKRAGDMGIGKSVPSRQSVLAAR